MGKYIFHIVDEGNFYSEWEKQAKALHQCIVSGSYYAKETSVLLFVRDLNDNPVSTHEASLKTKKIIQVYGDERDWCNRKPLKIATQLAEEWMKKYL